LLIPKDEGERGYRFLIFTPQGKTGPYDMKAIDVVANTREAPYLFIRSVQLSKTFDAASRRKFQIRAQDGIMLVAAGVEEYEVDIYYWSKGKFEYSPIDR
jgi:hypothetical protein